MGVIWRARRGCGRKSAQGRVVLSCGFEFPYLWGLLSEAEAQQKNLYLMSLLVKLEEQQQLKEMELL